MSSLIFFSDEQQVMLATDTLAVSPDGQPLMFTTKAFILPHLQMLIAGTGVGGFAGRWLVRVNDRIAARDIDHLNYHAPRILATFWADQIKEFPIISERTVTIYHFGFSQTDGLVHTYAYRSANNFESERIGYGLAVKPECQVDEDWVLPRDFRPLMDAQRRVQASKPASERVYIGGEITVHHMTKDGFSTWTADRFPDYSDDERHIYGRFARDEVNVFSSAPKR